MFGKKKAENGEAKVKAPKAPKVQKTANMKKLEDLYYAAEEARKHAYAPLQVFRRDSQMKRRYPHRKSRKSRRNPFSALRQGPCPIRQFP